MYLDPINFYPRTLKGYLDLFTFKIYIHKSVSGSDHLPMTIKVIQIRSNSLNIYLIQIRSIFEYIYKTVDSDPTNSLLYRKVIHNPSVLKNNSGSGHNGWKNLLTLYYGDLDRLIQKVVPSNWIYYGFIMGV